MRRRAFAIMMGTTALPMSARAQQPSRRGARIGVVSPFSRATSAKWHEAFQRGLKDLGWTEGTNLTVDYRFGDGRRRLPTLVASDRSQGRRHRHEVTEATTAPRPQPAAFRSSWWRLAIRSERVWCSLARPGANIAVSAEHRGIRRQAGRDAEADRTRPQDFAVLWNRRKVTPS